jgi:mannose-6-phosphate isomerase-like protein (cupin superfamily)
VTKPFTHVRRPAVIPVPGGKLIEELVGRVATQTSDSSVAHMVAPPGWNEPAQTPDFAETTVMVRGRLRIEVAGEVVVLAAGETIRVEPGVRVQYGNPFDDECEYYAICVPAFSIDTVQREE